MNYLLSWFGCGLLCAIICFSYDTIFYGFKVDKHIMRSFFKVVIFGFISAPASIYLIITDIRYNRRLKQKSKRKEHK